MSVLSEHAALIEKLKKEALERDLKIAQALEQALKNLAKAKAALKN